MKNNKWLSWVGLGLTIAGTIVSHIADKKSKSEEIDKAVAKYLDKIKVENA